MIQMTPVLLDLEGVFYLDLRLGKHINNRTFFEKYSFQKNEICVGHAFLVY